MSYATLTAGEGYLQTRSTLDADAKSYAESAATDFIDSKFSAWTRTAWTGVDIPREIERIALKRATYEFLMQVLGGNPSEAAENLKDSSEEETARVIASGGPLLADGTRQAQTTGTDPAISRYFEVSNG